MSALPVRFGVLGCADIATRRVLPALAAARGARVTAVASREGTRAGPVAAEYGCAAVHGYAGLLARDDVDAVYLPLPVALHAPWTERALRAGKHVLAEKPLTTSARRTAELFALARSHGLVLRENVMFLRHGAHRRIRELVDGGVIGRPRTFEAVFAIPPPGVGDIRLRPDLGGGSLLDVGVYPLRAAQLFLGDSLEVVGATLRENRRYGVDTSGTALLRTPRGVTAQLTFGMEHAYRNTYELWGSEGGIRLERAFTPPAGHHPTLWVEQHGRRRRTRLAADDQCANTVRDFITAVRSGGTGAVPDPDGSVALARLTEEVGRAAGHSAGRKGDEPGSSRALPGASTVPA